MITRKLLGHCFSLIMADVTGRADLNLWNTFACVVCCILLEWVPRGYRITYYSIVHVFIASLTCTNCSTFTYMYTAWSINYWYLSKYIDCSVVVPYFAFSGHFKYDNFTRIHVPDTNNIILFHGRYQSEILCQVLVHISTVIMWCDVKIVLILCHICLLTLQNFPLNRFGGLLAFSGHTGVDPSARKPTFDQQFSLMDQL
jgi:hypothetical protein